MRNKILKASLLILLVGCTVSCSSNKAQINSIEDLKNLSLSIGCPGDFDVTSDLDNICGSYKMNYIDEVRLGVDSVISGKIDGYICGKNFLDEMEETGTLGPVKVLEDPVKIFEIGLGLCETTPIENYKLKVDTFIAQCANDGTFEDMNKRWFTDSNYDMPNIELPSNPEYTLKVVSWGGTKPYSFLKDNKLVGFDIELAYRVCAYLNCGISLDRTEYPSMLFGLSTGKYDMISANLYISKERQENITYSIPYDKIEICMCVRDYSKAVDSINIIDKIKEGTYKTFVQENRWKTILSGLRTTLIITFFGFLLGNIFGAIFCYFAMSKSKVLNVLEDIYSKIMQGTPIVVILMVLFYIVFGNSSISGIYVAIFGFGLTSGSSLAIQFKTVLSTIPKEQKEAGLALGLTRSQTFKGIVLPQAIRRVLPNYCAELIAVLKGTAIVGYIAVTDLTKAGDLIRTATFESFFSLFSVALIYFLISILLINIMKFIQKKLQPKRVEISTKEGGKEQ